jgi:hypothetical protein
MQSDPSNPELFKNENLTTMELRKRLDYYTSENKQLISKLDDGKELRAYSESRIKILENQINAFLNSDFDALKNFDPITFLQPKKSYNSSSKHSPPSNLSKNTDTKSPKTSPLNLKYYDSADVHYKKPLPNSHHRKPTDQRIKNRPNSRSNVYESNYFTGFGVNKGSSDRGQSNRASSYDCGFGNVEIEADYYRHRYYDMLREKDSEIFKIRNRFAEVKGGRLREIEGLKGLINEGEDAGGMGVVLDFIKNLEKPLKTESSADLGSDVKVSERGVNVSEFSVRDTELQ